jgi:serine protease Do
MPALNSHPYPSEEFGMTYRRVTAPGWSRWLGLSVFFVWLMHGMVAVADAAEANIVSLPPVFDKAVPENKKDLLAIQQHVQRLLKKTIPATVGLKMGGAQGSGVIVSKDGIILTAGHVSGAAGRKCTVVMPDGRTLNGKTLGANVAIDSGMIQITDKGEYSFCEMADAADLKAGQWCMAIGHPGGWQEGRDPVVRLGRIQDSKKTLIQTDCTLVGGDSGGPLFDMRGKVIGIHSRIGNAITANIHVPIATYRDTWTRLTKAEVWGNAYMGLGLDWESQNCRIDTVNKDSPAAKAGLQPNDIVRMFDGKRISHRNDLLELLDTKGAGNQVTLEVLRGEDTIVLHITMGTRPR